MAESAKHMTSLAISYRINTANLSDVIRHLDRADSGFSPRLSLRVDIPEYARKIVTNAVMCEAWALNDLVGMIAGYCNDPQKNTAFITNVSVLNEWQRHGIAKQLFSELTRKASADGFKELKLEVAHNNIPALELYSSIGFTTQLSVGDAVIMRMPLTGRHS